MSALAQWLGLALMAGMLAAAGAAIAARTLMAMALHLAIAGALASAALVLFGAGDAALAMALFAAGFAPVMLMAAMLLSARTAKQMPRGRPWLTLASALIAGAAIAAILPEAAPPAAASAPTPGASVWFAVLALVAAAGCIGLVGYGERGALGHDL